MTSIEKLLAILFVHSEPEILGEEVKALIAASHVNRKMLRRYIDLVRAIHYAWQKVGKYEMYFKDFYPSNGVIGEIECLNHHIHAYLDDLYTVRQKVFVLLNNLKNDANKVASNAGEFMAVIKELEEKMMKGFKELDDNRGQHRHAGIRFVHGDLLHAENAESLIAQLDNPVFGSIFDEEKKKKLIEKITAERVSSFEKAKKWWIETAKSNKENLDENMDKLFSGLAQNIYQILGIEETAQAIQKLRDDIDEGKKS